MFFFGTLRDKFRIKNLPLIFNHECSYLFTFIFFNLLLFGHSGNSGYSKYSGSGSEFQHSIFSKLPRNYYLAASGTPCAGFVHYVNRKRIVKKIDVTSTLKILKSLSIPRQFRDDYQTWQIRGVSKIFHPNKKFLQAYVLDVKKSQKS